MKLTEERSTAARLLAKVSLEDDEKPFIGLIHCLLYAEKWLIQHPLSHPIIPIPRKKANNALVCQD